MGDSLRRDATEMKQEQTESPESSAEDLEMQSFRRDPLYRTLSRVLSEQEMARLIVRWVLSVGVQKIAGSDALLYLLGELSSMGFQTMEIGSLLKTSEVLSLISTHSWAIPATLKTMCFQEFWGSSLRMPSLATPP